VTYVIGKKPGTPAENPTPKVTPLSVPLLQKQEILQKQRVLGGTRLVCTFISHFLTTYEMRRAALGGENVGKPLFSKK